MRNTKCNKLTTGIIILAESALISFVTGISFITIASIVVPFVVGAKMLNGLVESKYNKSIVQA